MSSASDWLSAASAWRAVSALGGDPGARLFQGLVGAVLGLAHQCGAFGAPLVALLFLFAAEFGARGAQRGVVFGGALFGPGQGRFGRLAGALGGFFAYLERALKRREEHPLQVEVQQEHQNESGHRFQEQLTERMKSLVHLMSVWSESGVLTQTLYSSCEVRGPKSLILT